MMTVRRTSKGQKTMNDDRGGILLKVLDQYGVKYKTGRNGWQSVSCPNPHGHVHGDKTPSMRINITNGGVICHGCSIKGSGYDIIMAIEGCDFRTARDKVGVAYTPTDSEFVI